MADNNTNLLASHTAELEKETPEKLLGLLIEELSKPRDEVAEYDPLKEKIKSKIPAAICKSILLIPVNAKISAEKTITATASIKIKYNESSKVFFVCLGCNFSPIGKYELKCPTASVARNNTQKFMINFINICMALDILF